MNKVDLVMKSINGSYIVDESATARVVPNQPAITASDRLPLFGGQRRRLFVDLPFFPLHIASLVGGALW